MSLMYSIIPQYHDFAGKHEMVAFVIVFYVYVVVINLIHRMRKDKSECYMFCYCEGSRQKVVAREIVTQHAFEHYDELVTYPVLHMSSNCIYFVVE